MTAPHRVIFRLAKAMAVLGGIVLVLLVGLTCLSVLGRLINSLGHSEIIEKNLGFFSDILQSFGPINGDYELMEAGIAFAVFAFLPWCQLTRGHAVVEILTTRFPEQVNRFLAFLWEVLFALTLIVIAWRISVGMTDKMRYGETTFLLQMPVWWGFAVCAIAAVIASIVAVYSAWMRGAEWMGRKASPAINGKTGQ